MASINRGLGVHFLDLAGFAAELYAVAPELTDAVEGTLNRYFRATASVDAVRSPCGEAGGRRLDGSEPLSLPVWIPASRDAPAQLVHRAPAATQRCCRLDERTARLTGRSRQSVEAAVAFTALGVDSTARLAAEARVGLRLLSAIKRGGPCDPPASCADERVLIVGEVAIRGTLELRIDGLAAAAVIMALGGRRLRAQLDDTVRTLFVARCELGAGEREADFVFA